MAQSMAPPGWSLITVGGSRKAVNPQGQIVAYNQYLNAQAQRSGFTSHSQYRRFAKTISGFRTKENRKKLALGSTELKTFKELVLDRKTLTEADKRPGGPMATLMEDLGLRPRNATYPLGDTTAGD